MTPLYSVEVIIQNKPQARDPEGESITRDLIHKGGLSFVKEVRTGKLLAMKLEAENEEVARDKAVSMCNDLRLYNPVAHTITVRIRP